MQSVMDRFSVQPPVYTPPRNIQPVAPVQPQLNPAYGAQQQSMGGGGVGPAGQGQGQGGQGALQYPPAGAATQPQAPAPAPAPAPPRKPALSVAAIPSRFNGLDELSLEELQAMLEDEDAQLAFLHRSVPDLGTAAATLAAQRAAASEAAKETLALEEEIRGLSVEVLPALEAAAAGERDRLAGAMKRLQAINDTFKPERIARELDAYAEDQDKTSLALAESFANSDPMEYVDRFGSGAAGGGGGGGGGGSFYGGTQYSGSANPNPGLGAAGWGSPASTAPPLSLGVSQGTPSSLLDTTVAGAGAAAAAVTSPAGMYTAGASTMTGDPNSYLGRSGGAGGASAGGGASAAQQASVLALKEFREEYLTLRRRYHTARIQADILRKVGVAT